MIVRMTGILEHVEPNSIVLALESTGAGAGPGIGVAHELLAPAYLTARLNANRAPDGATLPGSPLGMRVTVHTMEYLESQGQGSSFIPRILAFGTPRERDFFELFTTVKGLGNKRATRALAEEPADVARAIVQRDIKALQKLPEIGKKLAETIVVDLREKAEPFAIDFGSRLGSDTPQPMPFLSPIEVKPNLPREAQDAITVIMALGQSRALAQQMVSLAIERNPALKETDEIVAVACTLRV